MRHLFLEAYFGIRPRIPWALRMALRRSLAKRSMRRFSGYWHTNELAGRAPEWWSGWPGGNKFAFVLTHDVERMRGLERCHKLAAMEMQLGFRSSFNFVPEGEYESSQALREFLATQGFEVGVHDLRHDGRLFGLQGRFREDAQKINQYLAGWGSTGFRSGFMLHNFEWIRELNIAYDASSFDTDPFEPQPEGTNTIFPFWVGRDDGSGYVELPYTLPQDSTLFLLLQEAGIDTWVRKLDWIARHGGMALLNVHPDYMAFDGVRKSAEYPVHMYEDFLKYVSDRYRPEAWFVLPKEIAAHVRQVREQRLEGDSCTPRFTNHRGPRHRPIDGGITLGASPPQPWPSSALTDSSDWCLQGKRVAMVMFSFYPDDPHLRRAAETLVSKGMKVDLICLGEGGECKRHEIVNSIDILRISISRRRGSIFRYGFEYGAFLLASALILAVRSLTRGYDLVYAHNMPDILVLSGLVPKIFGAKMILDLHDPMPELMTTIFGLHREALGIRLVKRLAAWSRSFADAVIAVDPAFAKLSMSRRWQGRKMQVAMDSPDQAEIARRGQEVHPEHSLANEKMCLTEIVVGLLRPEVAEGHPMASEMPLKRSLTL